jgi:hypothetical protein
MEMKALSFTVAALMAFTLAPTKVSADEQPRHARILADKPGLSTVFDDDGGKVEIFRRGEADRALEFHGGAVVREPLVQLVFLGAEWRQPQLAATKDALRAQLERVAMPDGIRPAGFVGAVDLEAPGSMNDLRIQSALDRAMRDGALPLRDERVIYVVFVAPGVESTLGEHRPQRDYDSYHSHFNSHDVDVRYVVVPFSRDGAAMRAAAAKSVVRAIINPDGDGWY